MPDQDKHKEQVPSPELGKNSSPVRDLLKGIKNKPRQEAEKLLGEAWKLVNLGVSFSKQWRAELYDQNAVFESNGGNFAEAQRLSLAGIDLLSKNRDKHNLTRARLARNLSQTYIATEDYDSAQGMALFALSEHDLDIEKFQHSPKGYRKGLRHQAITQTYYDRALILSESGESEAAKERLLEFLETHDSKTLPSEIERVIDFVEEQHIDPSIRDQFPGSKEQPFSLNPIKIGGVAASSAFRLANSGINVVRRFIPKP